jgi:uncharacterized membrane protein YoaK (UPF0700 family)
METFVGLLRDFVAAALGLAILFGANFSDDQVAGILLFVTTVVALGTWLYKSRRSPSV